MCESRLYPASIQITANGRKRWKKQEKIKQVAITQAFDIKEQVTQIIILKEKGAR